MNDTVRFGGKGAAYAGVFAGIAMALGLPALVLLWGKDLGVTGQTTIILSALACGGLVALVASFFGTVMPSHVGTRGLPMFGRFTDRARKVMRLANQEAKRFNHGYIGTEHILLGLVKEGSGVGANALKTLNIDLRQVRLEIEKLVKPGPRVHFAYGNLPQMPRAEQAIKYAIEEGRNLHHNYVGTEHLLLGLLREPEGVGGRVLRKMGVELEQYRKTVLEMLKSPEKEAVGPDGPTAM